MTSQSFNAPASNYRQTRAVMGKRIGEIIEDVLGDKRIRELFDASGGHPEEHAGKPTGIIALELGVITPNTKTALLVAQAAERAFQAAGEAGGFAALKDMLTEHGAFKDLSAEPDFVRWDDPQFKFVASPKDPPLLQKAQSTWMAAQLYLNNEVLNIHDNVTGNHAADRAHSMGSVYANGIRREAAELYKSAAELLDQEGHADAAFKLFSISLVLTTQTGNKHAPGAAAAVSTILDRAFKGAQDVNDILGSEYTYVPEAYQAKLEALIKATQDVKVTLGPLSIIESKQKPESATRIKPRIHKQPGLH